MDNDGGLTNLGYDPEGDNVGNKVRRHIRLFLPNVIVFIRRINEFAPTLIYNFWKIGKKNLITQLKTL